MIYISCGVCNARMQEKNAAQTDSRRKRTNLMLDLRRRRGRKATEETEGGREGRGRMRATTIHHTLDSQQLLSNARQHQQQQPASALSAKYTPNIWERHPCRFLRRLQVQQRRRFIRRWISPLCGLSV
ncbi:unnamed protein product [Pleuronectes platessa]|uniref:Uncharacterized protein n=1 Tax=Pleuronectes platessa TaxID=8262 RepID=A0A9N7UG27_PLEPL|nr:unnamed protein product [Pleuronectes platessa]